MSKRKRRLTSTKLVAVYTPKSQRITWVRGWAGRAAWLRGRR